MLNLKYVNLLSYSSTLTQEIFGDPPGGLGMGIFHLGLDQKIPGDSKSRGWWSGIWDLQESPVKNPRKISNPGDFFLIWEFFIPGMFIPGD